MKKEVEEKKDIMVYYSDWRILDDMKKDEGFHSMADLIKFMITRLRR